MTAEAETRTVILGIAVEAPPAWGVSSRPGAVVLFGSGEAAAVGRDALRWLGATERAPRCIAILETPGFEPNADAVSTPPGDPARPQPVPGFVRYTSRR